MTQLTILEGSTFCICDELGDIARDDDGLFADDTRFLSRPELTIDGKRPLLLSSGKVEYFSAAFFLRNPLDGGCRSTRSRSSASASSATGCRTTSRCTNETTQPLEFGSGSRSAADFADIISVKEWDFSLGDPKHAKPLPEPVEAQFDDGAATSSCSSTADGLRPHAGDLLRARRRRRRRRSRYDVDARAARDVGRCASTSCPAPTARPRRAPRVVERHFGEERARVARVARRVAAARAAAPRLAGTTCAQTFAQSVERSRVAADAHGDDAGIGKLPAAGMPWFMTVFGRDTLITCLQTLLFGPELARARAARARRRCRRPRTTRRATPSRGRSSTRCAAGSAPTQWFDRYYGTVDATPLFLILLSEAWRWTDDTALVARAARSRRSRALALDRRVRRPRRRRLRRVRAPDRRAGSTTSRGRTPATRSASTTAGSRRRRSRRARCRATSTTRSGAWPSSRARSGATPALADRLEREADELRERFDEAFWVEERGGYYALALDADKSRVDSLCSNIGHLLWSGIVPPRARRRRRRRADGRRRSGRAGASARCRRADAGVQPAQLPQRHRLAARQLADRVGARAARALARGAPHRARDARRRAPRSAISCPRSSPGCRAPRRRSRSPIRRRRGRRRGRPARRSCCSSSCSASSPTGGARCSRRVAPLELPGVDGRRSGSSGVRAFGRVWDVRLEDGDVYGGAEA